MSRFDIAIVGAGPAGSWAAYRLARAGVRVLILDGSHPREKPCGGGVTGRALALVAPALDVRKVAAVDIAGATFTHGTRDADVPLGRDGTGYPPLLVVGRREFDGALLAAALEAGAELRPMRVTGLAQADDGWIIKTRDEEHSAGWLLGADGANSFVRRHVLAAFPRASLSIATGFFVRDHTSRDIVVAFEDAPPGYLWSFPRPDHLAVGLCAQADESASPALLQRVRAWIDRHVGSGATLDRYSWPIPSLGEAALGQEQPAGQRWMLLGDAAGLVDPITREGIFFALRSADLAADALVNVTNAPDPAAAYAERIRTEIHSELIRAARLKARFFQPHFVDLLVAALARSGRIRAIMADLVAGRQTYEGLRRRLLMTLEWRLMLELFGY
jgi:geranylgeranyl reductase family protein